MALRRARRGRQLTLEEMQVHAIIKTGYGNIMLEFFPDIAPNHVSNFINLARQKFYDGLQFHRVAKNFVIQAGCPFTAGPEKSKYGTGNAGYSLNEEFSGRKHKAGTLSMARGKDVNSASSQFFICLGRSETLDGKYTVFGQVVAGMDTVQRIGAVPTDSRSIPRTAVFIKKVEIKRKDEE